MLHLTFEQLAMLIVLSFMTKFIVMWAFALWQTDKDLKESKKRKEEKDKC